MEKPKPVNYETIDEIFTAFYRGEIDSKEAVEALKRYRRTKHTWLERLLT
jgi:hypothetical protein